MRQQPPRDNQPQRDSRDAGQTDADVTSETRFGPRPVPAGHRRPSGAYESRHIPPSGDVSPDGRRAYPRPSRFAKWVVWGGTGIAAAALTAGTVFATRQLCDLIDDRKAKSPTPRTPPAPKPAPAAQPLRFSTRENASQEPAPEPVRPEPAPRPSARRPSNNIMKEIQTNTADLTDTVDNVMRSLTSAMTGFRGVAAQASSIVREFGDAAELVRNIIAPAASNVSRPTARPANPRAEAQWQTGRTANAQSDDPLPDDVADDPRSHRL